MRIQHNIMAMNSYRNYTSNTSALAKNLEKLSSGYKINRAGDDAAGLAISEKMRAQITGLSQAQANAKSGINLVQTAEGALTEVHDMLNRMVKLADQSANGTYDDKVDRNNLQKEITQLKSEIDRIADASNFNGIKLLDGSLNGGSVTVSPKIAYSIANAANSAAATLAEAAPTAGSSELTTALGAGTANSENTFKIEYQDADGKTQTMEVKYKQGTASAAQHGADVAAALNADSSFSALFKASDDGSGKVTITNKDKGSANVPKVTKMGSGTAEAATVTAGTDASTTVKGTLAAGDSITVNGTKYSMGGAIDEEKRVFSNDADLIKLLKADGYVASNTLSTGLKVSADPKASSSLTLQIGDTADSYNQLKVSIGDMHADALGIGDIDISAQNGAAAAVDKIKTAINTVSSVRGDLGATQNRLEHTMNNLSVMQENIQDAEATIRDVDVAEEMMAYTKNNILVQSAQAMLAQANQVPQGVLQLLQ